MRDSMHGNTLSIHGDRALYIGELAATGWHRHACPVLLIGLSGRFAVHLAGRHVETCRSALIDAGIDHVFDPRGEKVALLYLEPDAIEARRLRRRFLDEGPVIWDPAVPPTDKFAYASRLGSFDLASLLQQECPRPLALDPRVAASLHALRGLRVAGARAALAAAAGLSESRFNHLFREETGVSFRSYRVWSQVRKAMSCIDMSRKLTSAALEGGFSDSSHFSRTFRKTFGMTPSSVLKPLQTIQSGQAVLRQPVAGIALASVDSSRHAGGS